MGIKLTIFYSDPNGTMRKRGDNNELPPPLGQKVPGIYCLSNRLLLQFPFVTELARADLIIIVHAGGYLINYPLLLLSRLGMKKVALWGHGYNHQGNLHSRIERLKRRLAACADWWFTYTAKTSDYTNISLPSACQQKLLLCNER